MRVYHGTINKIKELNNSPIWLTPSFDYANEYVVNELDKIESEEGCIYEFDLNVDDAVFMGSFENFDTHDVNEDSPYIMKFENNGYVEYCVKNASSLKIKAIH